MSDTNYILEAHQLNLKLKNIKKLSRIWDISLNDAAELLVNFEKEQSYYKLKEYKLMLEGVVYRPSIGITDLGTINIGPRDIGPKDIGITDTEIKDIGPKDIGINAIEIKDIGIKDIEPKDIGINAIEIKDSGIKDIESKDTPKSNIRKLAYINSNYSDNISDSDNTNLIDNQAVFYDAKKRINRCCCF